MEDGKPNQKHQEANPESVPDDKTGQTKEGGEAPSPEKTTATIAGYGVDDILKAPVEPPSPAAGDRGPQVAEKMNQATYKLSEKIGPKKPELANLTLVGLGIFICLLGLLGFVYLGMGGALTLLAIGFIATALGIFMKF